MAGIARQRTTPPKGMERPSCGALGHGPELDTMGRGHLSKADMPLVHNHSIGRSEPSAEDESLIRRVKAAAAAVDLRFVDHLIVAREGRYSFRAAGLL
ncbi:MAG: hypothetical protein HY293_09445 [Planctomycetes bacterium]|nr:hypothetical protein [Planctomycetota bacterium]